MFETGVLILLAATAQAGGSATIPAFFTGERLYAICTGRNPAQCWMYVSGVLDGAFETEARLGSRSLCATRITNRDAAERVTDFLRRNPDYRSRAASVAVRAALQSELKCSGE